MNIYRPATRRIRTITILLVMALLVAQWSGMSHRIAHASFTDLAPHLASLVDAGRADDTQLRHSCVAFDAAAVADSIHAPPFAVTPLAGNHVLALWTAFASWDAPFVRHFPARAPPSA